MLVFMLAGLAMVFLGNEDLFSAVAVSGTASLYLAPVVLISMGAGRTFRSGPILEPLSRCCGIGPLFYRVFRAQRLVGRRAQIHQASGHRSGHHDRRMRILWLGHPPEPLPPPRIRGGPSMNLQPVLTFIAIRISPSVFLAAPTATCRPRKP